MLQWLLRWRIEALEVDLAEVDAVIAAERETTRQTGYVYPTTVALNAKNRARIVKTLEQLRAKVRQG